MPGNQQRAALMRIPEMGIPYLTVVVTILGLLVLAPAVAWSQAQTVIYRNDSNGNLYAGVIDGTNHPVTAMIDANNSGDPHQGWLGQIAVSNGYIYLARDGALFGAPIDGASHPGASLQEIDNSGWEGPLAVADGYIYQMRGRDLYGGAIQGTTLARGYPDNPSGFHLLNNNSFVGPNDPPATDIAVMNGYIYAIVGRDIWAAPISGANHEGQPQEIDNNFVFVDHPEEAYPEVSLAAGGGYIYAAYKGNLWGGPVQGAQHPNMQVVDLHGWDGDIAVAEVGTSLAPQTPAPNPMPMSTPTPEPTPQQKFVTAVLSCSRIFKPTITITQPEISIRHQAVPGTYYNWTVLEDPGSGTIDYQFLDGGYQVKPGTYRIEVVGTITCGSDSLDEIDSTVEYYE